MSDRTATEPDDPMPVVLEIVPGTEPVEGSLQSTNPCESMIETVRRISRNVKRWHNGDMCLRWTAAGMLEAQQQFRPIIGHTELAKLALAVERDIAAKRAASFTSQPLNAPSTGRRRSPPPRSARRRCARVRGG